MGIFSRWISTAPDVGLSPDECDFGQSAKTLRGVRSGSDSLAQFLKDRQLMPLDETYAFEQGRERVEKSGLLRAMLETCTSLNELAGRTLVDVHTFLPPDPILCCFIYVENGNEYFMRLEMQGSTPTLLFIERQWHDTATNDFLRWARRLAEIDPVTTRIRLVRDLGDVRVSAEHVRGWFMYLVSGLEGSYTPTF